MNKKIIFFLILFASISSFTYCHSDKIFFYDKSTSLSLSYKIEKHPSESIVTFNIPDIFIYYKWRHLDKKYFHKEMLNLLSNSNEYNRNSSVNVVIRTDFLFFKNNIIYSERYRLNKNENIK